MPRGYPTMVRRKLSKVFLVTSLLALATAVAGAQSFHVQCPATTITHPNALPLGSSEPPYVGPTYTGQSSTPTGNINGAIKCQEISGGDGYMTEADGNQTFMFSFGPLSGLGLIQNGQPGTQMAAEFNLPYTDGPNFFNGQANPLYNPTNPNANGAITDPAAIMNT